MNKYIKTMTDKIVSVLHGKNPTVYLLGSFSTGDFKEGWSDIDILCLTEKSISKTEAEKLLYMRQNLSSRNRSVDYMRLFEGGFLSLDAFINESSDTVVYWGTSGERITDRYVFNPMSLLDLLDNGILLYGDDKRNLLKRPSDEQLKKGILAFYKSLIRIPSYASKSVYTAGWMLDIARCIYTLETGKIISKTGAGELALKNNWCPEPDVMEKVLEIRRHPDVYSKDEIVKDFLNNLSPHIKLFAKELEKRLIAEYEEV